MRRSLVPVFILATAALSSSNVLPLLSTSLIKTEPFGLDGQPNDNTYNNIYPSNNILNDIFYKVSVDTDDRENRKSGLSYVDAEDDGDADDFNIMGKHFKYNGEGFRKEQWHNYPRQLDRLHKYLHEHYNADNRSLDPDDPGNDDNLKPSFQYRPAKDITDEFRVDNNEDTRNIYDSFAATTNPLLILKIRLACLSKNMGKGINRYRNDIPTEVDSNKLKGDDELEQVFTDDINPEIEVAKVKREDEESVQNSEWQDGSPIERRSITKRIFSLWSRLQSLNHKGHELHHRRNLHAFYGLPDGGGTGILTAETRATLMRPPGSPLRWG